jgi:hypothetical protein
MTEEVIYDAVDPELVKQENDVPKQEVPEEDDARIRSAALRDGDPEPSQE